jgi:hypothetical protein
MAADFDGNLIRGFYDFRGHVEERHITLSRPALEMTLGRLQQSTEKRLPETGGAMWLYSRQTTD